MKHAIIIVIFFVGLIVSAIHPHDYFTWILEVAPALVGFMALLVTFKKFRFTTFTYIFILIHCYILFIGGHYTYAEEPFFGWLKDVFNLSRNNYDKLGHFAQGFVPALVIRELFIRKNIVNGKGWTSFITLSICLAISAVYELIEWFVSALTKEAGDSFLGTQGYVWDTQSDMLYALIGALAMVVFVARIQDKQIHQFKEE